MCKGKFAAQKSLECSKYFACLVCAKGVGFMAYYPEFDPEKKKETAEQLQYQTYDEKELELLARVYPMSRPT